MPICTVNGAYASFEEKSKGMLASGKLADFVMLENDPHDVDPDTIKDIQSYSHSTGWPYGLRSLKK